MRGRVVSLTIEELLAREEITDVIKRLARGTDRLDEELMASCYHPDGVDDHNAFRGSGTEFAKWVVTVLPHFTTTMHFIGPPNVSVDLDADVAQADTYCVAHHINAGTGPRSSPRTATDPESTPGTDMVLGLRYVDRFERRDGTWLIAKRVCAFDWTYTIPIDPTNRYVFEADYTVGHRDRTDITYIGV